MRKNSGAVYTRPKRVQTLEMRAVLLEATLRGKGVGRVCPLVGLQRDNGGCHGHHPCGDGLRTVRLHREGRQEQRVGAVAGVRNNSACPPPLSGQLRVRICGRPG